MLVRSRYRLPYKYVSVFITRYVCGSEIKLGTLLLARLRKLALTRRVCAINLYAYLSMGVCDDFQSVHLKATANKIYYNMSQPVYRPLLYCLTQLG